MKSIQLIARDIDYSDEAKTNLCEMQKECDEFILKEKPRFCLTFQTNQSALQFTEDLFQHLVETLE